MIKKGIYPHGYMDSTKRFKEDKSPQKFAFYNILTMKDIDNQDYKHEINVWKIFEIKNLGEYHDLYIH